MPVQELAEVDILPAYHTSCFFVVAVVVSCTQGACCTKLMHKLHEQNGGNIFREPKSLGTFIFPSEREDFGVSVKFYLDIIRLQSKVLEAGAGGGDERWGGGGGGGGGAVVEITRRGVESEGCVLRWR